MISEERKDDKCYLRIFNENRNKDNKIILNLTAKGRGNLNLSGGTIPLSDQKTTYKISLPFSTLVTFSAENGDTELLSYSTARADGSHYLPDHKHPCQGPKAMSILIDIPSHHHL